MSRYIVYTAAVTPRATARSLRALTHGPTADHWPGQVRCVSYPGSPITLAAGHAACLAAVNGTEGTRGVVVRVLDSARTSIALFSGELPARLVTLAREHVTGARDPRDVAGTEITTPAPATHHPAREASIALWHAYLTYAIAPRVTTAAALARVAHAYLRGAPTPPRAGAPPEPVPLDPRCPARAAVHEIVLAADVAGLAVPEATGPALAELLLALDLAAATATAA